MDENTLAYFSSINPLARKIIKDELKLKTAMKDRWEGLNWEDQEALIDAFIVDNTVRERYADTKKLHSYPKSFPKLKVETGEKIVVDFENDFWTWQDEHSAPFNWRTKSQQDLTLDDLEPDALYSKPANKSRKSESSNEHQTEKVEEKSQNREFSVQTGTSIWESPFLQGVKKPDFLNRSRSTSPAKSATASRESLVTSRSKSPEEVNYACTFSVGSVLIYSRSRSTSPAKSATASRESLVTSRSKSPEEVNYAFSGSVDDLSSSPSYQDDRSPSASSGEIRETSPTPSQEACPSKPPRSKRSSSKSPVKSILSSAKKSDSDIGSLSLVYNRDDEELAFDNPAAGHNWSSFVNDQEEEQLSSATPSPYKSLLKEPEPVGIDRGENIDNQSSLLAGYQDNFQDEILFVEKSVDKNQSVDEVDNLNASSMSKTGFDFLDNW